jgi:hypothetical protein
MLVLKNKKLLYIGLALLSPFILATLGLVCTVILNLGRIVGSFIRTFSC